MTANGTFGRRLMIVLITVFLTLALDQWTKSLARQHLMDAGRYSWVGDTIRLDYAENRGAFLSLGSSLDPRLRTAIFSVACSIGMAALLIYTLRSASRAQLIPLSLVIGGGVGNLIDRYIRDGAVTDFLNVGIGNLRTGIFNVADLAISIAFVWIVIVDFRERKTKPKENQATS